MLGETTYLLLEFLELLNIGLLLSITAITAAKAWVGQKSSTISLTDFINPTFRLDRLADCNGLTGSTCGFGGVVSLGFTELTGGKLGIEFNLVSLGRARLLKYAIDVSTFPRTPKKNSMKKLSGAKRKNMPSA